MIECENFSVGREYLASVSWPTVFRNETYDRCYCSRCYLSTYPDTLSVAGGTYVIPRGWTRFGMYIDEIFAHHHKIWDTWVNCYHGTSIESAKSIVEHRQLLLPRDVTMHGKTLEIREGHIPKEFFFFTTPSIMYAALKYYGCEYRFISPHNSELYTITVALQCKQKPGSFIVQAETVGAQQRICPYIPNDELEWKTQNRSAIVPYQLLLRVKRYHDNQDHGTFEPELITSVESMRKCLVKKE
jgi:hypothetical protein